MNCHVPCKCLRQVRRTRFEGKTYDSTRFGVLPPCMIPIVQDAPAVGLNHDIRITQVSMKKSCEIVGLRNSCALGQPRCQNIDETYQLLRHTLLVETPFRPTRLQWGMRCPELCDGACAWGRRRR